MLEMKAKKQAIEVSNEAYEKATAPTRKAYLKAIKEEWRIRNDSNNNHERD